MYTLTIGLQCDDKNVFVRQADVFTMAEDKSLPKKYLTCIAHDKTGTLFHVLNRMEQEDIYDSWVVYPQSKV